MSGQLEILPEVKYRIQSIDYGTFLERRDVSVILRQLKEDNKNQEWTFIRRDDKSSVYEIRNLDDSDSWSLSNSKVGSEDNENIGAVEDPILAVDSDESGGKQWRFILKSPGTSYDFYMMSEATSKLFAYVTLSTAPALKSQSISNIKPGKIDLSENYQWRLAEVTPASLPYGTPEPDGTTKYRIRNLNGKAFHSVTGVKSLSIGDEGTGDQREFVIVSKGNGKCTIYSVKEKKFLSVTENPNTSDQWVPTLEPAEHVWNIRQLSNITWSICVDLEISKNQFGISTNITFALTVKNLTIILKPMKFAHNQMWLIEPADAPSGTDAFNAGGSVSDGTYVIRNRAAGTCWSTHTANINCWAASFDTARSVAYGTWSITHDEYNNVRFKSLYAPGSWAAYGMTVSLSPVSWRLIPVLSESQCYYLTTDMTNLKPPVATNVTSSSGTFTELQEGSQTQLWQFIRI